MIRCSKLTHAGKPCTKRGTCLTNNGRIVCGGHALSINRSHMQTICRRLTDAEIETLKNANRGLSAYSIGLHKEPS